MLEFMRDFIMNRTWAFVAIIFMLSGITIIFVQISQPQPKLPLTVADQVNVCIKEAEWHFPSTTLRVEDHVAISQACSAAILKSQN